MYRNLSSLVDQEYDVVVVGGGVFGICIAWDAALRGLSVALLERNDFCGATSANSFKMIHGGIRYLQHGDLYRIRESCRERSFLLRAAPHLAHPLPIVVPTYGRGLERKNLLRAAFLAYDLATWDRNRGIHDQSRKIPNGRIMSRDECLAMFPGLERERLTSAGVFYDGQMYNPPRLALALLKSAIDAGAEAANYMEITGFLTDEGQVTGVVAHDRLADERLEIRGRVVVNAAGAWAGRLLQDHLGVRLAPSPTFSRDACFVVGRRLLGDHALAVQGKTKDPDALVSRGKRHLFIVPWRHYTLVGVWHVVHTDHPDRFTVTEEELQGFIDEINGAYPALELTLRDVSMWNAGLVLFGQNQAGSVNLSYGKRSLIVDHAQADGFQGLVTVVGVRWTTARGIAEKAVDLVFRKMQRTPPRCQTENSPVHGGQIEDFEQFVKHLAARSSSGLDQDVIRALAHNHGTEASGILEAIEARPDLGQCLGSTSVLRAEVVHAVRSEMAQTLKDVALRRTDLATGGDPGREAIRQCGELVAAELGWGPDRLEQEIEEVTAVLPRFGMPHRSSPASPI